MMDQGLATDRMIETIEVELGFATSDGHVPSPNHLPHPVDRGARHPGKTPTTRSGLGGEIHHVSATTKRAGSTPEYKLTSYSAWWKRMEKL